MYRLGVCLVLLTAMVLVVGYSRIYNLYIQNTTKAPINVIATRNVDTDYESTEEFIVKEGDWSDEFFYNGEKHITVRVEGRNEVLHIRGSEDGTRYLSDTFAVVSEKGIVQVKAPVWYVLRNFFLYVIAGVVCLAVLVTPFILLARNSAAKRRGPLHKQD